MLCYEEHRLISITGHRIRSHTQGCMLRNVSGNLHCAVYRFRSYSNATLSVVLLFPSLLMVTGMGLNDMVGLSKHHTATRCLSHYTQTCNRN